MSSLTHIIENSSNGGDKKEIWSGNFKRARRKLRTYFHGLNEIFNAPNYPMRIFWLSVVISAVFCACWMSQWLLEGAMQQRTVAKIEYLTPDTLKYPIITICDRSGSKFLNYTQLANDNVTDEFLKMMFLSGPIWVLPYSQIPRPTLLNDSDAQMFLSAWQGNSSDATMGLRRFLLHYSLTCEEIFSSCRDANWDKLNCCKMFSPVFHLRQGICYASNPDFIPSMVASGLFSNLYLKFKRPKDPYRDRKSEKEAKFGYEISIDTGVDQGLWRADVIKLDFGYWAVATFSAKRITTDSTIEVPCDKQPHLDCFKVELIDLMNLFKSLINGSIKLSIIWH